MANFEGKLYKIEDDIQESWLEDWADEGATAAEKFLVNYQTFAVQSITKAIYLNDTEELAYWGLSEEDVLDTEFQQLAA